MSTLTAIYDASFLDRMASVFGLPTWIGFVVVSERIEVDKATINVQPVVNKGCLMPIPAAKVISGVLPSGVSAMNCKAQQRRPNPHLSPRH